MIGIRVLPTAVADPGGEGGSLGSKGPPFCTIEKWVWFS